MRYHLSIICPSELPLGTPEQVVARIALALPQVKWEEGPSSFEEATVLASLDIPWSDEQRAVFSLPKRTGTCDGEGYSLRLYNFESCPLTSVTIDVVGEHNPLPLLQPLCLANEWRLVGRLHEGRFVFDLQGDFAAEWNTFRQRAATGRAPVGPPVLLRIEHESWEEDRFHYVGVDGEGNQFMAFVSGAFPESGPTMDWEQTKRWYAILHRFDARGNHLATEVWNGGSTADGEALACGRAWQRMLKMVDAVGVQSLCDINVRPFEYEEDGYRFGLEYEHKSYDDPEDPAAGYECVMLWPNDIMFHPPWDSGKYSS